MRRIYYCTSVCGKRRQGRDRRLALGGRFVQREFDGMAGRAHRLFGTRKRQQRTQRRGQDGHGRSAAALQPSGPGIVLFRNQQADSDKRGRLLEGVHETEQEVDHIQVPDLQHVSGMQHKHSQRSAGCQQVRDQHNALFVLPVHHASGQEAEKDGWQKSTYRQQGQLGYGL